MAKTEPAKFLSLGQEICLRAWPPAEDMVVFNTESASVTLERSGRITLRPSGKLKSYMGGDPLSTQIIGVRPTANFVAYPKHKQPAGFIFHLRVEATLSVLAFYANGVEIGPFSEPGYTIIPINDFFFEIQKQYAELDIEKLDIEDDYKLFLHTLQDLENKVLAPSKYNLTKASGLIRLLIAEDKPGSVRPGESFGLQIADKLGIPLSFSVAEQALNSISGAEAIAAKRTSSDSELSVTHAFYINRFPPVPQRQLGIDDFLNCKLLYQYDEVSTVFDFIKTLAEVSGGIHKGQPKSMKVEKNRILNYEKKFTDELSSTPERMRDIGSIVLTAFKPVADAILSKK